MCKENTTNRVNADPISCMTVLFIMAVLLLHSSNYTQDYLWEVTHRFFNPYETGLDKIIQKFAVGGFLFLSGYKLTLSKRLEAANRFWISRFQRIYPLYFVAVVLFSFTVYPHAYGNYPNFGNFLIHALCFQSWLPGFFQGNYLTIWFVSNLFFCYLTFLILRQHIGNTLRFSMVLLGIVVSIYLVRWMANFYSLDLFSNEFDLYFIFFSFGMLASQLRGYFSNIKRTTYIALVASICLCMAGLFFAKAHLVPETVFYQIVTKPLILGYTLSSFILIQNAFGRISVTAKIANLLKYLSAASFCVFLFHRVVWVMMSWFWPEKSYLQSLYILGAGIPLIFFCSYWLQFFYSAKVLPILAGRKVSL